MLSSYWHEGNGLEAVRRRGEEEGEWEEREKGKKGHSRRTISVGLNEKIKALLCKEVYVNK